MKAWIKNARAAFGNNSSVSNFGNKQISFTSEFKIKAVKAYKLGHSPSEIFQDAGLDPEVFPENYCSKAISRWLKSQDTHGVNAFKQERRGLGSTGRPKGPLKIKRPMSIEQMEARLAYLEAENDFLKKLHALAKKGE